MCSSKVMSLIISVVIQLSKIAGSEFLRLRHWYIVRSQNKTWNIPFRPQNSSSFIVIFIKKTNKLLCPRRCPICQPPPHRHRHRLIYSAFVTWLQRKYWWGRVILFPKQENWFAWHFNYVFVPNTPIKWKKSGKLYCWHVNHATELGGTACKFHWPFYCIFCENSKFIRN